MPVVDMPLEELKEYQGVNPRPADFDEFWNNSLKELAKVDPEVKILPAEFKVPYAECFHLYFSGLDGARVHCKYLRPKGFAGKHPGLVEFHGYSGNSGDWISKLSYVAAGFSVLSMDCRGQGGLSEDRGGVRGNTLHGHIIRGLDDTPEKLYYRNVFLDTARAAAILMDMDDVDDAKVAAKGGSQGGGLTMACVSLETRINRAVPCFPFLSDYKRVWDMDLDKAAYQELRDYFRRFDPRHEREDEVFEILGYIDIQHLAPRIRSKVKMVTGLIDTVCPPSTQFAAYNKIKSEKDIVLYPDFGHEALPGMPDIEFAWITGML
jgi:cephalosporin-C deacetylase